MSKPNAAGARRSYASARAAALILTCLAAFIAAGPIETAYATGFRENRADANGDYLWSYTENWTAGVPTIGSQAEIGDDNSGPVYAVLDVPVAECRGMEIAEAFMRRTSGSGLHIPEGTSLTSYSRFQVGKDDLGFLTVDGSLTILPPPSGPSYPHFDLGHYGHSNARGTATISSTGSVYVDGTVHILGVRMPGSPWGDGSGLPVDLDYGSSLTVAGELTFRRGVRIFSGLADLPGTLRIEGDATIAQGSHWANHFTVEGGGTIEIDGGDATIDVLMLNFAGGADYYGNDNPATLKLTGSGVSTINNVGATTFGALTLLDVSELSVGPGTYTVIDGASISDGGLAFAAGTDTDYWSFDANVASGNLLLTYDPGLAVGDMDGSNGPTEPNGNDINPFVMALIDRPSYELAYPGLDADARGDCAFPQDGLLNGNDINAFVALLLGGSQAVPDPATLSLLCGAAAPILLKRRRSA